VADQSKHAEAKDPRVDTALSEFLERIDRGEAIEREAFLARYSEIADALRPLLTAEVELRKLAAGAASPQSDAASRQSFTAQDQETIPPKSKGKTTVPIGQSGLQGQFGRYQIVSVLGKGAMGTVYLAQDTQLKRPVALKTPHFNSDPTGALLARFYREARAAATLRHANICSVYEVGEINGTLYISLAYIEGRPLSELIRPDKPQPERQILVVIRKLAQALQHAHDHGIVHRDLKPANIVVDQHGEPIVMDFGLARKAQKDGDATLTRSGMILGSPAYMSPEQVEGDPDKVGGASDQYSLGVIFYEMLVGRSPFQGSVLSVLAQIITKEISSPLKSRPELDPRIEAVCMRMIARNASDRFASLKAVADELLTILKTPDARPRSSQKLDLGAAPSGATAQSSNRAGSSQILKSVTEKVATERDLLSLEELARKCLARHDYEQVIQIIERITEAQRTSGAQSLLDEARAKNTQIAVLVDEIEAADRLNDARTALNKADELLKVKPGHHRAREIQAKYSGPRAWRAARLAPLRQFRKPWKQGGWIPWSALAFGLAVFATMSGVIYFYVRGTVIVVNVLDPDVDVAVKGSTLTITGPDRKQVRVDPGNHDLEITYGDLHFTSDSFSLKQGEKKTVTVSIVGKNVVLSFDGETFVLEPKEKEGKTGPAPADTKVAKSDAGKSSKKADRPASLARSPDQLLVAPFDAAAAKMGQETWSSRLKMPVGLTNSIGMALVLIPPGEFQMGLAPSQVEPSRALMKLPTISEAQKKDALDAEQPPHKVRITRAFYMGRYEVTRGEFAAFVRATHYKTEPERNVEAGGSKGEANSRSKGNLHSDPAQDDSHPVQAVTWNDAVAFCAWLTREEGRTYRLPTEAEWEYSCRGGTETLFYFGNDPADLTRFENVAGVSVTAGGRDNQPGGNSLDGRPTSSPVGRFRPNPFGLFDMLGNVREWCQDWFGDDYYGKSPVDDPPGPDGGMQREPKSWDQEMARKLGVPGAFGLAGNTKGSLRVFRGGGSHFQTGPGDYRSSSRGYVTPAFWTTGLGFRVTCEARASKPVQLARAGATRGLEKGPGSAPRVPPTTRKSDPDRDAAEWAISHGGTVRVFHAGKFEDLGANGKLPASSFELRRIDVASKSIDDSQLTVLDGLNHLRFLRLHENPVTDAGVAHIKGLTTLVELDLSQTNVGDAGLSDLKGLSNLNRLYVWFDRSITDAGIAQLEEMASLTDLDLNQTQVTDDGLAHLRKLKNLRYLNLMNTRISGAGFVHLKQLPNLSSLDLDNSTFGDEGMEQIGEMEELSNIRLSHTHVTDAGLAKLKNLRRLNHLNLIGTSVTDAGLAHLGALDDLGILDLDRTRVSGSGLESLKALARLRYLGLNYTGIKDADLVHLKTLLQLDRLGLRGTAVTDEGLASLRDMKYLAELDLTETKVTAAGVEKLHGALPDCRIAASVRVASPPAKAVNFDRRSAEAVLKFGGSVTIRVGGKELTIQRGQGLPRDAFQVVRVRMVGRPRLSEQECSPLRHLTNSFDVNLAKIHDSDIARLKGMAKIYNLGLGGTPVTDRGVAHLRELGLTGLRHLDLGGTRMTDAGLAHVAPLVRLEGINLSDTRITDDGLRHLESLKSLGDLWFSNVHLTDAGMTHLGELIGLRRLGLGGTRVTDSGLKHLGTLVHLEFLNLGGTQVTGSGLAHLASLTQLRHLVLDHSQLTDDNLTQLKSLPRLERLDLRSVAVTDNGLEHLKDLATLRDLDLSGTKATSASVQNLRKALPACRIVFK
jgi:formylglycine-generating enzyme required for sulfatase activity/serine/threonine protein kinase/Leucine-rich repeat (LRR) protein